MGVAEEGVARYVQAVDVDREERGVVGRAQERARPLVREVRGERLLDERTPPGAAARDRRRIPRAGRDPLPQRERSGPAPPSRGPAGRGCWRRSRRVVAQQVEIGGEHEALDALRRVGPPEAHHARGDPEGVERVPEGAPPARGRGHGAAETSPARSRSPTSAPLGKSSKLPRRAQDAVGREALHSVIAGQAARHDRRPDRRTLGGPEGGEGTRGAAPGESREGGERTARDPLLDLGGTQTVDTHEDHAAHGAHGVGGDGDGAGLSWGAGRSARGRARVAAGARTARAAEEARERWGKTRASAATPSIVRSAPLVARHEAKSPRSAGTGIEWR